MKDRVTGIKCDLQGVSKMGVLNSGYVKFCCQLFPLMKPLVMLVKIVAEKHDISGSGKGDHLNSYSLVLLVIFFLQGQGFLHSLNRLQSVPGTGIINVVSSATPKKCWFLCGSDILIFTVFRCSWSFMICYVAICFFC